MVQPTLRRLSPKEYLSLERAATDKHELVSGELFAMAGGSREHNLIAGNVVTELNQALRARRCVVYPSDMKIKAASASTYHYPDASVVCGEERFEDDVRDVVLNPTLLVEVLSDSTERYDRGDKFASYQQIASFTDYLLLSSKQTRVEHFAREADGSWRLRAYGPGERIPVVSLGVELEVDELYRKVFDAPVAGGE